VDGRGRRRNEIPGLQLNPQLIGLSPSWRGNNFCPLLTSISRKTKQMAASILLVAWRERPEPAPPPPQGEEAETKVEILLPSSTPLSNGALFIASEVLVLLRCSLDDVRRSNGEDLVEEICLRHSWAFSPARWSWRDIFGVPAREGVLVM